MLKTILISVLLILFGVLAEYYLYGGRVNGVRRPYIINSLRVQNRNNPDNPHNWWKVIIPAISVGLMHGFVESVPIWLAWIFFILTICVIFHYVAWRYKGNVTIDKWRELVMFLLLFIVSSWALVKMAKVLVASITDPFWSSVIGVAPWLFMMLVPGVVLVLFLWTRKKKVIALILAIALLAGTIATVVSGVEWPKKVDNTTGNVDTVADEYGWHFYNLDMQEDNDEDNDFVFGPNPVNKSWTAADYDDNFRTRLAKDPALGAADIAWLDANVGTRLLGEFYDSCKGDWAKTINAAKVRWIENPSEYFKTLAAFFGYLDEAEISIAKKGNNITDQMYMNPYTTDTIPDVIVLKTKQQDGPFLVYTFTIKGNTFKVEYRIPCGYQPTNVKIVMGIAPQSKPSKSSTSGSQNSGGSGGSKGGSEPTTKPVEPTTRYNKDPSKSSNSGKNDDKGPGKNTNTGGNKSSEEKNSNSNNLSSYSEYRKKIQEMQEANTTTAPSKSSGTRDSNESEASKPTPTKPKPSEITTDPPAQQWNGPSD